MDLASVKLCVKRTIESGMVVGGQLKWSVESHRAPSALRKTPLSGQLPSNKELASEGSEARRGARPKVASSRLLKDVVLRHHSQGGSGTWIPNQGYTTLDASDSCDAAGRGGSLTSTL
ncbi:uncharacterized protein LACBIDRAFT_327757 [Laccaria bicolor S238N-H82]|uniref:Predicted protein n=1 Tax=Laccaria bicolor (strain S238N-H82 / ATCC MYA-4686) TaxID=486041 RepID=B0DCR1_LACBS|nr:uncharacterized protein LACBIDRAFT_327757 [Laccaria bicolor S238N-H82]EDR07336.1 predicted protein [Laccaria bicolor S238N-H82]|eukprot:XP_001881728.1 predicted protein [Laccaria bicolor S238N-H82]